MLVKLKLSLWHVCVHEHADRINANTEKTLANIDYDEHKNRVPNFFLLMYVHMYGLGKGDETRKYDLFRAHGSCTQSVPSGTQEYVKWLARVNVIIKRF